MPINLSSDSGKGFMQIGAAEKKGRIAIFIGGYVPGKGPDVTIPLDPDARQIIRDNFKKTLSVGPNGKYPIRIRVPKKREGGGYGKPEYDQYTLIFGRNEHGIFYIEFTGDGAPERFILRGTKNVECTGDTNDDASRSKVAADSLMHYMTLVWDNEINTSSKYTGNKNFGGGNNSYQKQSSYQNNYQKSNSYGNQGSSSYDRNESTPQQEQSAPAAAPTQNTEPVATPAPTVDYGDLDL